MKLTHSSSPEVIVVGAGLAGLVAASQMQRRKLHVQVLDKSGDLGGRLATRRRSEVRWNHGAPAVQACSAEFHSLLESLCEAGSASRTGTPAPGYTSYAGAPDMRGLLQPLGKGLDIRFGHEIQALTPTTRGWEVRGQAQGRTFVDHAYTLVCTAPGPQTARLLAAGVEGASKPVVSALTELQDRLASVEYSPCWTALLQFDQPVELSSPHSDSIIDLVRPWSMLEQNHSRHWIVQAKANWSLAHLEQSAAEIEQRLLEAWRLHERSESGRNAGLQTFRAHRWRYARCSKPMGGECWWDPSLRLGLAGDWFVEPDAQGAFTSAQTLVETMTGSWLDSEFAARTR